MQKASKDLKFKKKKYDIYTIVINNGLINGCRYLI